MKALGAIICEIMGDPNWTKRLSDRAAEYEEASKTPTLNYGQSEALRLMSNRARNLAVKSRFTPDEAKHPSFLTLTKSVNDWKKANEGYRKATDELYPNRKIRRLKRESQAKVDQKSVDRQKAIKMIPSSVKTFPRRKIFGVTI